MTSKYTKELLEEAVKNSISGRDVLRNLGLKQAGGTQAHVSRMIKKFEIDTSHFLGQSHSKGTISSKRLESSSLLVVKPIGSTRTKRYQLYRAMIEVGTPYKCFECSLDPEWNDKPLTLEIDHVDGDFLNNLIENLRFMCPNCHSQQETTNKPWKTKDTYPNW